MASNDKSKQSPDTNIERVETDGLDVEQLNRKPSIEDYETITVNFVPNVRHRQPQNMEITQQEKIEEIKMHLYFELEEWVGNDIPEEGEEDYDTWQRRYNTITSFTTLDEIKEYFEDTGRDFDQFFEENKTTQTNQIKTAQTNSEYHEVVVKAGSSREKMKEKIIELLAKSGVTVKPGKIN